MSGELAVTAVIVMAVGIVLMVLGVHTRRDWISYGLMVTGVVVAMTSAVMLLLVLAGLAP